MWYRMSVGGHDWIKDPAVFGASSDMYRALAVAGILAQRLTVWNDEGTLIGVIPDTNKLFVDLCHELVNEFGATGLESIGLESINNATPSYKMYILLRGLSSPIYNRAEKFVTDAVLKEIRKQLDAGGCSESPERNEAPRADCAENSNR